MTRPWRPRTRTAPCAGCPASSTSTAWPWCCWRSTRERPDESSSLAPAGGLELKAFADAQPGWRLTGVDPSAAMLGAAERHLGPLTARVELQQGYVDDAPQGPFDGAACLLTLHFLELEERLHTLREIHRRLAPGARLVVAHHSHPGDGDLRHWLGRSLAFAGSADGEASASVCAMERLPILAADEDERVMREAGFPHVELFYAAFTFRGWVGTA